MPEADSRHTRLVVYCYWSHITRLVCNINLHSRLQPLCWGERTLDRTVWVGLLS